MRAPLWLAFALAACGAAFVTACGGRSSLDDQETRAAPVDRASGDAGLSACETCLPLACTLSLAACELDDACFTIYHCAAAGGEDCICLAEAGASAYLTLLQCVQAALCDAGECGAACAGATSALYCAMPLEPPACNGEPIDAGESGSREACNACAGQSCASFQEACAGGSACEEYVACLAAAPPTETAVCAGENAGGESAAEALDVCLGGACETECGF